VGNSTVAFCLFELNVLNVAAQVIQEKTSPPSGLYMTTAPNFAFSLIKVKPGFGSIESFALLLGTTQDTLLGLLYPQTKINYITFSIPKKNGDVRTIHAPKNHLKHFQRLLAKYLLTTHNAKSCTHGFVENKSIKTNAQPHIGKEYVFNIDLKDFFQTIHYGRVKRLFMAYPFNASENVATVVAQLCCFNGHLAQGAPTSPIISNMIALKLDGQLLSVASKNQCHYTRYVDDLTFSFTCKKHRLPKDIVKISNEDEATPGETLTNIILKNGFTINPEKTRLKHRSQRQVVAGVTVNEFTNLPRSYIRLTGSLIYALEKFGPINAEIKYVEGLNEARQLTPYQLDKIKKSNGEFFKTVVKGRLDFLKMIRGKSDSIYRKLAYRFSKAIGKEDKNLMKSAQDILGESVFVVEEVMSESQGTAFLLDGAGIVTNFHVVDGITQELAPDCVSFITNEATSRTLSAQLVFSCKERDLAIFYPDQNFDTIRPLKMRKKDGLTRVLDPILSMGYPNHSDGTPPYFNTGKVVQQRNVLGRNYWLVDIPLLKGNSGGPIFNKSMEVIGIATIGTTRNDLASILHGFLPVEKLKEIIKLPEFIYRKRYLAIKNNQPNLSCSLPRSHSYFYITHIVGAIIIGLSGRLKKTSLLIIQP
jgi:RNA-directed DNA polymerase